MRVVSIVKRYRLYLLLMTAFGCIALKSFKQTFHIQPKATARFMHVVHATRRGLALSKSAGSDSTTWKVFNGSCGSSIGLEENYVVAEDKYFSQLQCIQTCQAQLGCKAATVNIKRGKCRLTTSCAFQIGSEAGEITMLAPHTRQTPHANKGVVADDNHERTCDYCAEPRVCHSDTLCRFGKCFAGSKLIDGVPCGEAAKVDDTGPLSICLGGECVGQLDLKTEMDGALPVVQGFNVLRGVRCVHHMEMHSASDIHACGDLCRVHSICSAFSQDIEQHCRLFDTAMCTLKGRGWMSGIKVKRVVQTL